MMNGTFHNMASSSGQGNIPSSVEAAGYHSSSPTTHTPPPPMPMARSADLRGPGLHFAYTQFDATQPGPSPVSVSQPMQYHRAYAPGSAPRRATVHNLPTNAQSSAPISTNPHPGFPLHPPSQSANPSFPTFDPQVASIVDAALKPVSVGLENIWEVLRQNMYQATAKLHQDFVRRMHKERQEKAQLKQELGRVEGQMGGVCRELLAAKKALAARRGEGEGEGEESLKALLSAARNEAHALRRQNEEMNKRVAGIVRGFQNECAKLRAEKEGLEVRCGLQKGKEGGGEGDVLAYMRSFVDDKMAAVLDEIQEQRRLRIQAEQRLEALLQVHQGKGFPIESPRLLEITHSLKRLSESSMTTSVDGVRSPVYERVVTPSFAPPPPSTLPTVPPPPPPHHQWEEQTYHNEQSSRDTPIDLTTPPIQAVNLPSPTPSPSPTPAPGLGSGSANTRVRELSVGNDDDGSGGPPRKRSRLEYELGRDGPHAAAGGLGKAEERSDGMSISVQADPNSQPAPRWDGTPLMMDGVEGVLGREGVSVSATREESMEEGEVGEEVVVSESGPELGRAPEPTPEATTTNQTYLPPPPPPLPGLKLKSESSPPATPPPRKLGLSHIDLLYKTDHKSMTCQLCLTRMHRAFASRQDTTNTTIKRFPLDASWSTLVAHCREEHPTACRDLEKLSPSQIRERKERMLGGGGSIHLR